MKAIRDQSRSFPVLHRGSETNDPLIAGYSMAVPQMMLGADRSDFVFNIIILRDSRPTWLFSRRLAHYGI